MQRIRIGVGVLVVALVAGVLAGCGGDDGASESTVAPESSAETTTSVAETTTTSEDPTAAVEQAFYDQWDAYLEIVGDPDPTNPLIDEHFVGNARDAVLDGVSSLIESGNAIRPPSDRSMFEPRIVAVEVLTPTTAAVFECTLEGLVIFNQETGEVVDDAVSEFESRNDFELVDGRFRVSSTRDVRDGEPGCDDL